jgi:hypothetical protein
MAQVSRNRDPGLGPWRNKVLGNSQLLWGCWRGSVGTRLRARTSHTAVSFSAKRPQKHLFSNHLNMIVERLTAQQTTSLAARANAESQHLYLALAFEYRKGENGRRFPASASTASSEGVRAGPKVPSLRLMPAVFNSHDSDNLYPDARKSRVIH